MTHLQSTVGAHSSFLISCILNDRLWGGMAGEIMPSGLDRIARLLSDPEFGLLAPSEDGICFSPLLGSAHSHTPMFATNRSGLVLFELGMGFGKSLLYMWDSMHLCKAVLCTLLRLCIPRFFIPRLQQMATRFCYNR
jgi:hypothetical protein